MPKPMLPKYGKTQLFTNATCQAAGDCGGILPNQTQEAQRPVKSYKMFIINHLD
jgi:hypothetical protein